MSVANDNQDVMWYDRIGDSLFDMLSAIGEAQTHTYQLQKLDRERTERERKGGGA